MEKELKAWGNSSGIRFLQGELKEVGRGKDLKIGDVLIFTVTNIRRKEEKNGKSKSTKRNST